MELSILFAAPDEVLFASYVRPSVTQAEPASYQEAETRGTETTVLLVPASASLPRPALLRPLTARRSRGGNGCEINTLNGVTLRNGAARKNARPCRAAIMSEGTELSIYPPGNNYGRVISPRSSYTRLLYRDARIKLPGQ